MQPQWKKLGRPLTDGDVAELERSLMHRLPPDYREFLLRTNGAVPVPRVVGAPNSAQEWSINVFFGLTRDVASSNLWSVLNDVRGTLPHRYFPVAATDTGEFILLDRRAGGPVVLWQWQEDITLGVNPHLHTLAPDFTSFLHAFRADPT